MQESWEGNLGDSDAVQLKMSTFSKLNSAVCEVDYLYLYGNIFFDLKH